MAPSTIMVTAQAYSQNKKNKDDFLCCFDNKPMVLS